MGIGLIQPPPLYPQNHPGSGVFPVRPADLPWTYHEGSAAWVTANADGTMTITVPAASRLTMSAFMDLLPAGLRAHDLIWLVDASAAWAVLHRSVFAMVLDAAGAHVLGANLLHWTAGSITSSAGPPLGLIHGGGFGRDATPLHYRYGARISGAAGASGSGSNATLPGAVQRVRTDAALYRDDGSGDRWRVVTGAGQTLTTDGATAAWGATVHSSVSVTTANINTVYPYLRAAIQIDNTDAVPLTYQVTRLRYQRGLVL